MKKYFCEKCKPHIRRLLECTEQQNELSQEAELMLQDLEMGEIEAKIIELRETIEFIMSVSANNYIVLARCKSVLFKTMLQK